MPPLDLPGVEDVIARQFLGSGHHLLSADDADVVRSLQVFGSGVGVSEHGQKKSMRRNEWRLCCVLGLYTSTQLTTLNVQ